MRLLIMLSPQRHGGHRDSYLFSFVPLIAGQTKIDSHAFGRTKFLFLSGSYILPIGISSPRRRLSEPEADGQNTKLSVLSVALW